LVLFASDYRLKFGRGAGVELRGKTTPFTLTDDKYSLDETLEVVSRNTRWQGQFGTHIIAIDRYAKVPNSRINLVKFECLNSS
jgi:hypothetical protein